MVWGEVRWDAMQWGEVGWGVVGWDCWMVWGGALLGWDGVRRVGCCLVGIG